MGVASIRQRELALTSWDMPAEPLTSPALRAIQAAAAEGRCTNCESPLPCPRPAFCSACGQETRIGSPTVAEFVQQFGGAYFSTEGALWRTLKLLLLQPGELTRQYLAGRRKHHVLPLRLYLSISLVLLIVVQLAGNVSVVKGLDRPDLAAAEKGSVPTAVLEVQGLKMGIRDGVYLCEGLPRLLCQAVRERAATDTRTFLSRLRTANERMVSHFGAVMFVLLPLFAGCLRLVHLRRGMPYTEHLVFALHLHSFWFVVLVLMHLPWQPLVWIGFATMAGYTLLAGRRVYGGKWLQQLLGGTALTLMYMALLGLTVPLAWLLALLA